MRLVVLFSTQSRQQLACDIYQPVRFLTADRSRRRQWVGESQNRVEARLESAGHWEVGREGSEAREEEALLAAASTTGARLLRTAVVVA